MHGVLKMVVRMSITNMNDDEDVVEQVKHLLTEKDIVIGVNV
jgi:hypothetical protein